MRFLCKSTSTANNVFDLISVVSRLNEGYSNPTNLPACR